MGLGKESFLLFDICIYKNFLETTVQNYLKAQIELTFAVLVKK